MKVKEFYIRRCLPKHIKGFVKNWHYSRSINGVSTKYCFQLLYKKKVIGAMIYGLCGMPAVWKCYVHKKDDLLELRRLCCIDATPKNTESRFIGLTLKWIKKNTTVKKIISYADPEQGHKGTIYKASNFVLKGTTNKENVIIYKDKVKEIHYSLPFLYNITIKPLKPVW